MKICCLGPSSFWGTCHREVAEDSQWQARGCTLRVLGVPASPAPSLLPAHAAAGDPTAVLSTILWPNRRVWRCLWSQQGVGAWVTHNLLKFSASGVPPNRSSHASDAGTHGPSSLRQGSPWGTPRAFMGGRFGECHGCGQDGRQNPGASLTQL